MKRLLGIFLSVVAVFFWTGCATKGPLKARTVRPSAFLEHASKLRHDPRAPFDLVWHAPGFYEGSSAQSGIYIAPVTTQFLRPVNRPVMQAVGGQLVDRRPVAETARLVRSRFIAAFQRSPKARLDVVERPGPGALTLELAVVELNPTNVVGNLVRYGAPGGFALTPLNKGNISIEGKLRDSQSGKVLYEFADNEQDQFAVVSLRDLSAYGHSRVAIGHWARQFEELTRTPRTHKVLDSLPLTLNPF